MKARIDYKKAIIRFNNNFERQKFIETMNSLKVELEKISKKPSIIRVQNPNGYKKIEVKNDTKRKEKDFDFTETGQFD